MPVRKGIDKYFVSGKMHYLMCSKGDLFCSKKCNDVDCFERSAKKEMRRWCLMLGPPSLPPPSQVDADRYPNKDKWYVLGGVIITPREVIKVTRREHLFIFVKLEYFGYHELYCVQRWFIFIRYGSETHSFEDIE